MSNRKKLPPSNLEDHVGYWLRYVSNHVSHAFGQRLEKQGVTGGEWVVLRTAYDHPVTSVGALAQATGLTRGAVSKLVDRLVGKRLLAKKDVAVDKRRQEVALTSVGRALVPQLAQAADENDACFFGDVPITQRKQLVSLLRQIVETRNLGGVPVD